MRDRVELNKINLNGKTFDVSEIAEIKTIRCTACKKPIGKFEVWNYCPPTNRDVQRASFKIFGNLCAECATYMCEVKFK